MTTTNIGRRVRFKNYRNICCSGTVVDEDHDGNRLLIMSDDGLYYSIWASEKNSDLTFLDEAKEL